MTVLSERDGSVSVVTIARPEARNAVNPQTAALLHAAFTEAERDDRVLVHVLTGAGGHFCAGFDLKVAADPASAGPLPERPPHAGPMGPSRMLTDRDHGADEPGIALTKPLIAAVEGYAVAGGLELALLADMRVASTTAVFGVYCRRWGVPLIDGGTLRLPRVVGHGRAMDMILTGRPVAAEEALQWGLANRLTGAGEALRDAVGLAQQIARFPQGCLRADRASAYAGWSRDLEDALRAEARRGQPILAAESGAGAARFAAGLGRGGDFEKI
jgi:enoyl-CoA hydratase